MRQVFIGVYRLEIQSAMLVFRPSFVNYSPSNPLSGSQTVCGWEGMGDVRLCWRPYSIQEFNTLYLTRFRNYKIADPIRTTGETAWHSVYSVSTHHRQAYMYRTLRLHAFSLAWLVAEGNLITWTGLARTLLQGLTRFSATRHFVHRAKKVFGMWAWIFCWVFCATGIFRRCNGKVLYLSTGVGANIRPSD